MRKPVTTLVVGAILLAGCGGGVEGQAVAGERWDPCSITPEALAATGLDPEYRVEGWGEGIDVPDWDRCVFHAPGGVDYPYGLNVMASVEHTIAEARSNPSNREGRAVDIAGRIAYRYLVESGPTIRDCHVALEMPLGVAVFTVMYRDDDGVDACDVVIKHVSDLESAVPAAPG